MFNPKLKISTIMNIFNHPLGVENLVLQFENFLLLPMNVQIPFINNFIIKPLEEIKTLIHMIYVISITPNFLPQNSHYLYHSSYEGHNHLDKNTSSSGFYEAQIQLFQRNGCWILKHYLTTLLLEKLTDTILEKLTKGTNVVNESNLRDQSLTFFCIKD